MDKEIGKIYDGYWVVIKRIQYNNTNHYRYVLRNNYNGKEIIINEDAMTKIKKGDMTISKHIYNLHKNDFIKNKLFRTYKGKIC